MNVGELKNILMSLPDNMEVILQKDGEGNGYSPLSRADSNIIYIPSSSWSGVAYSTEWTASDMCMEEDEWEELKKKPRVLVLEPIN